MRRRRIQDAEECYTERRRCRRHGAGDLIVSILLESSTENERIYSDGFSLNLIKHDSILLIDLTLHCLCFHFFSLDQYLSM